MWRTDIPAAHSQTGVRPGSMCQPMPTIFLEHPVPVHRNGVFVFMIDAHPLGDIVTKAHSAAPVPFMGNHTPTSSGVTEQEPERAVVRRLIGGIRPCTPFRRMSERGFYLLDEPAAWPTLKASFFGMGRRVVDSGSAAEVGEAICRPSMSSVPTLARSGPFCSVLLTNAQPALH